MLFLVISLLGIRQVVRLVMKTCHQKGIYLGHALIIGTSQHAQKLYQTLQHQIEYGLRIDGFVAINAQEESKEK